MKKYINSKYDKIVFMKAFPMKFVLNVHLQLFCTFEENCLITSISKHKDVSLQSKIVKIQTEKPNEIALFCSRNL